MSKIRVGHQFFKRGRREYRNWIAAIPREFAQNSQDAAATEIRIEVRRLSEDRSRLIWTDNGRGMDRVVLENVFFALGETTKSDGDTGGFGKARELTCFSMERYAVRTQDLYCEGVGDEYTLIEADWYDGCRFDIDVDVAADVLRQAVREYFRDCNPRCAVYLDSEKIDQLADVGDHRRDLTFGHVFVNDKKTDQRCIIRVNGLYMFERWIEAKALVCIELEASRSRLLLTSNRDGLASYETNREMDSFINELAVDVRSAIRKRLGQRSGFVEGKEGLFVSKTKEDSRRELERIIEQSKFRAPSCDIGQDRDPLIDSTAHQFMQVQAQEDSRLDLFSVIIEDETEPTEVFAKMRAVRERYDPRNWKAAYVRDKRTGTQRTYNIGGNLKKLLIMWKVACECCIEILQEIEIIGSLKWSVGWYFCKDRGGCCKRETIEGAESYFFCLCPVDLGGKMAFSLSSVEDMHRLIWLALHETLHVARDWHDEDYAGLLTLGSPLVSCRIREILSRMNRAAKATLAV